MQIKQFRSFILISQINLYTEYFLKTTLSERERGRERQRDRERVGERERGGERGLKSVAFVCKIV